MTTLNLKYKVVRVGDDDRRKDKVKVGIKDVASDHITQFIVDKEQAALFMYDDDITVTVTIHDGEGE